MSPPIPSFEAYLAALSPLRVHSDPTLQTVHAGLIRTAAKAIAQLPVVDAPRMAELIAANPSWVPTLGLIVGLSQESLKNTLRHHLGSTGWMTLARTRATEVIGVLDREFDLLRLADEQRHRKFEFGDVLVARAGTRQTAVGAGATGRRLEDEIEAVALELGLPYKTRTRFVGRNDRTAPCDLAIPSGGSAAQIVVAAKGFDSTGSKLSDAVREIEEMAEIRLPTQFTMAAVDGIGWKSRVADLRRIYDLWTTRRIDGLYTVSTLPVFRTDLEAAAKRLNLL